MNDHDQSTRPTPADGTTTPPTTPVVSAPEQQRPVVALADEAALVPAHPPAIPGATIPGATANLDPDARAVMAAWAREEVIEAHVRLLGDVHDIDFHHYTGGPNWFYENGSVDDLATTVHELTDRLGEVVQAARDAVAGALGRRDWLTSGRLLRCAGCGDVIDPTTDTWRVCRDAAEHTVCHLDDPTAEDQDRAWTREQDEEDAYCEDHERDGGPRDGDSVEVTYPDGRRVPALWEIDPDGTTRAVTGGPILGDPHPTDRQPVPVDLTDAVRITVTWVPDPNPSPITNPDICPAAAVESE